MVWLTLAILLGGFTLLILGLKGLRAIAIIAVVVGVLGLLFYVGSKASFFKQQSKTKAQEQQLRKKFEAIQQEAGDQLHGCRMTYLEEDLFQQCEKQVRSIYDPALTRLETKLTELDHERLKQKKFIKTMVNLATLAFLILIGIVSLQIAKRYYEKYS
ncbi:MAG: hypothetical protein NUV91_04030 [Candidatus Omnitrophica bacterium]|nr:hypothetical protein [Candidatus Omnitrophota bacterium]